MRDVASVEFAAKVNVPIQAPIKNISATVNPQVRFEILNVGWGKKEGESEKLTHLTQEGSLEDTIIVV